MTTSPVVEFAPPTQTTMASTVAIQAELVSSWQEEEEEEPQQETEFRQFQQTFGPPTAANNNNNNNKVTHVVDDLKNLLQLTENDIAPEEELMEEEEDCSYLFDASFWDVLASCAMLFLWLLRSTFGVVSFLRSLVLGHCLRLLFASNYASADNRDSDDGGSSNHYAMLATEEESISDWMQKYLALLRNVLLGNGTGGSHNTTISLSNSGSKQVHAWPPPALVALATLTIVALVVHPDGMTWIIFEKIRDTMMSLLESSTTCWEIMIRDYGVVGTVSASASIALVLVLAIAMHKTFLSNCCGGNDSSEATKHRNVTAAEKKRRRRKGHHHTKSGGGGRGGGGSRIKGSNSGSALVASPSLLCPRLPKVEEVLSDGGAASDSSSSGATTIPNLEIEGGAATDTPAADENPQIEPVGTKQDVISDACFESHEEEGASIMTSPSALESVVSADDVEAKGRGSVPSVCTVDTAAMSDDISCGSMSVRSGPPRHQQQPSSRGSANNKGKRSNSRGGKANSKSNGGQKQSKANGKVNQSTHPFGTRAEDVKAATAAATYSSSETRFDSSNRKFDGQRQNRGGRGRAGNNQNSRGGRGKGGRLQKNQNTNRTQSPLPTLINNLTANTPPKSDFTVISTSAADASSQNTNTNNNRLPPVSPYSQSLFSCEVGNSGWSLPSLPMTGQDGKANAATPTWTLPALSHQTNSNSFVEPYSQLPSDFGSNSDASVDLSCGLWNADNQAHASLVSNTSSILTTPQRSLRAPPGLPAPPALVESAATPTKASTPDLYTPVCTPVNNHAPSLVPVTPSFGTPSGGQQAPSYSSWPSSFDQMSGGANSPSAAGASRNNNGGRRNLVKENPFAVEWEGAGGVDDAEDRIEAELQELLDF